MKLRNDTIKHRLHIRIESDVYEILEMKSMNRGMTISRYIEYVFRNDLIDDRAEYEVLKKMHKKGDV